MATYKLIQNIEAEDKILGPLTLRQFIFALVGAFLLYLCFIVVVKHVIFLLIVFVPPALFCVFFALPFGRDQPTEVWALAKLRYWFKPRRRVWNQSGVKELVTITVPKKVERVLTNGLSQTEVTSRLKALADTIDSRGWAIKNVTQQPVFNTSSTDRLIDISNLPQEVPNDEIAANDMLDASSSPIARQFDSMITQSSRVHRQQLIDNLNDVRESEAAKQATPAADNWFTQQSQAAVPAVPTATAVATSVAAGPTPVPATSDYTEEEAALSAQLTARAHSQQGSFGNLRTMRPLGISATPASVVATDATALDPSSAASQTAVTAPPDPAILSLAQRDDLNVATLAREARKNGKTASQSQDEVVIALH